MLQTENCSAITTWEKRWFEHLSPYRRLCLTLVSVLLLPRAPMAIGVATMSTVEMLTSGLKGRGFSVLHTFQDHLWWVQHFFCLHGVGVGERAWVLRLRSVSIGPSVLRWVASPRLSFPC
jgi:hypothetical protein